MKSIKPNCSKAHTRVFTFFLSVVMLLSLTTPAFAASEGSGNYSPAGPNDTGTQVDTGESTEQEPEGQEPEGQEPEGTPDEEAPSETPSTPSEVEYYGETYECTVQSGSTSSYLKTKLYSILRSEIPTVASHSVTDVILTSSIPSTVTSSGTAVFRVTYDDGNFENVDVSYTTVLPDSYEFISDIADIRADSSYNKNFNALLDYVNSNLALRAIGDEFNSAIGNASLAAPKFTSKHCTDTYNSYGGVTYTFIQDYNGTTLVREFYVSEVSKSTPSISINYDSNTLRGTDSDMQWSIDRSKWSKCSSNMEIPKNMMGETVYFQYPATDYYAASDYTSIYVPYKADKPDEKLELTSSSKTITILNCDSFDDCEFSLDDENWVSTNNSTYTFKNLSSGTSYKVYVRVAADAGDNLASDSTSSSIKTLTKEEAGASVVDRHSGRQGYVYGILNVESDQSGSRLTATIPSDSFTNFAETIEDYVDDYSSVTSSMMINQFSLDGNDDINYVKVSIPLNSLKEAIKEAEMTIDFNSDVLNAEISNSELSRNTSSTVKLEFSELTNTPSGSKLNWVKDQYKDGRPVYKVSATLGNRDLEVNYSIPYSLGRNETIGELNVYLVTTNGSKYNMDATYNTSISAFEFTTDLEGYIVIADDGVYEAMPFVDVPSNYWAYNYIRYCYNQGIFAGVSSTQFAPNSNVTRAMIFTLLARMYGFDTTSQATETRFDDVPLNVWYAASANWASENKLVSGKEFNGDGQMTRSEIAVVLYDYLDMMDYEGSTDTKNLAYTDLDGCSSSEKKAISFLGDLEIMVGTSGTTFSPNGPVTRAQMATILYRVDNLIN